MTTTEGSHTTGLKKRKHQTEDDDDEGTHPVKQIKVTVSPFFSLPRELRDQIYSNVLNHNDYYILRFPGFTLVTGNKEDRNLPYCMPIFGYSPASAWSFANKQMSTESIDVLVREKTFHIRHHKVWDRLRDKPTSPVPIGTLSRYQGQKIAESIRIIQLPLARNIWYNTLSVSPPATSHTYVKNALIILMSCKKASEGATRPQLRLLWDYDTLAGKVHENPAFNFVTLNQLRGAFASVRIEAISNNPAVGSHLQPHNDCFYNQAWVKGVRDRLYEHAEQWARELMGQGSAGVNLRCTWSEERPFGFESWSRTVEVGHDI
jgi:hypothetical protein